MSRRAAKGGHEGADVVPLKANSEVRSTEGAL